MVRYLPVRISRGSGRRYASRSSSVGAEAARLLAMSNPDLELAQRLADEADSITARHLTGDLPDLATKADGSPVTEVDRDVEQAVAIRVESERPEDGYLGEEVGEVRTGRRRWIVDGIDGTAAFVARRPEWATLIGLEDEGRLVVGIASSPALGRRWWASAREGAWTMALDRPQTTQRARIAVSRQRTLSAALGETWVPSYRRTDERESLAAQLASICRSGGDLPWATPRPPAQRPSWGSGHPGGALLVAAGLLDCFVMQGGGPWDHAATAVLVEEAGGRFSDLAGEPRVETDVAVFSNGLLHDELLERLRTAS